MDIAPGSGSVPFGVSSTPGFLLCCSRPCRCLGWINQKRLQQRRASFKVFHFHFISLFALTASFCLLFQFLSKGELSRLFLSSNTCCHTGVCSCLFMCVHVRVCSCVHVCLCVHVAVCFMLCICLLLPLLLLLFLFLPPPPPPSFSSPPPFYFFSFLPLLFLVVVVFLSIVVSLFQEWWLLLLISAFGGWLGSGSVQELQG